MAAGPSTTRYTTPTESLTHSYRITEVQHNTPQSHSLTSPHLTLFFCSLCPPPRDFERYSINQTVLARPPSTPLIPLPLCHQPDRHVVFGRHVGGALHRPSPLPRLVPSTHGQTHPLHTRYAASQIDPTCCVCVSVVIPCRRSNRLPFFKSTCFQILDWPPHDPAPLSRLTFSRVGLV